jgi:RNA polymerase sigma-70 factor (ECF subfamily)
MWDGRETNQPDDDTLVRTYQQSPEGREGQAAVSYLLARWRMPVYGWVRRFVRDREDALDLAQECLVQAYRALPGYETRGRFAAWLFTIVHNRCIAAARRKPRILEDVDTDDLAAPESRPDEQFESDQQRDRVFAAMESVLTHEERTALWLRAWEGMSVESITALMKFRGATGAPIRPWAMALLDETGGA